MPFSNDFKKEVKNNQLFYVAGILSVILLLISVLFPNLHKYKRYDYLHIDGYDHHYYSYKKIKEEKVILANQKKQYPLLYKDKKPTPMVPSGAYDKFLKIWLTIVSVTFCYLFYIQKRLAFAVLFVPMAILFNPVSPFYVSEWIAMNIIVAIAILSIIIIVFCLNTKSKGIAEKIFAPRKQ
jgi:hypothetical protein